LSRRALTSRETCWATRLYFFLVYFLFLYLHFNIAGFCFNKIIHLHIGLSLVIDLGLQVYKTQTTNKQETNVQVKSHPHIRFLPTHPHSISAAYICILPVPTSADPHILTSAFYPLPSTVTFSLTIHHVFIYHMPEWVAFKYGYAWVLWNKSTAWSRGLLLPLLSPRTPDKFKAPRGDLHHMLKGFVEFTPVIQYFIRT